MSVQFRLKMAGRQRRGLAQRDNTHISGGIMSRTVRRESWTEVRRTDIS